ncbi:MAG: hypothetical protein H6Q04_54 [Acidobacteria bacterium]|nr:hypothetical protein [Acidobacteriota bacterium]
MEAEGRWPGICKRRACRLPFLPSETGVLRRFGITCLHPALYPASWCKFTPDPHAHRLTGGNQIPQDSIYGVLVEDAKISICGYVCFQRLELQAQLVRNIIHVYRAEIRKACFRAYGSVLRNNDLYFIRRILVFPAFDCRERRIDAGSGMFYGVTSHGIELITLCIKMRNRGEILVRLKRS